VALLGASRFRLHGIAGYHEVEGPVLSAAAGLPEDQEAADRHEDDQHDGEHDYRVALHVALLCLGRAPARPLLPGRVRRGGLWVAPAADPSAGVARRAGEAAAPELPGP